MNKRPKALMAAPQEFEPGRDECRYVRWMLELSPSEIWPIEPDNSEEGNQHLVDTTLATMMSLNATLEEDDDGTPEFAAYRRTLAHCNGVLEGRIKPPPPHSYWDFCIGDLKRGIYMSKSASLRLHRLQYGLREEPCE